MQRRIDALDGLRGTAVLLVVGVHVLGLPWGWTGVDLFFCLSGYLITSTLLKDRAEPHYWKRFYVRRVTRILPPYLLLLVICVPTFRLSLLPVWYYFLFSIQNYIVFTRYFALLAPLNILWSLAIEEQFYLAWPLMVKRASDKFLLVIVGLGLALEPLARFLNSPFADANVPYYATPYRLDGLLSGALLALLWRRNPATAASFSKLALVGGAAVLLTGVSTRHWSQQANTPTCNAFLFSSLAFTFTGLIGILILQQGTLLQRFFSLRLLRFFGRISYGLYLYHFAILIATRRVGLKMGFLHIGKIGAFSIPISILAAYLSFRFMEAPAIRFGRRRADALLHSVQSKI